ncbi:MAG: ferrous iron transport protein B [Syntrophales bacterium]
MKSVLLIGLPNVGKSTIFSRLINSKVRISTYPGSAVEVKRGGLKIEGEEVEIIDIPGVYSLFSSADNENVARNILLDEKPDLIVQVSDAKNLKRSFALTSLLAELNIPLILILNMVDEAAQKGIKVKRHKLEDMLGTAVIETVASEGVGIAAVISALDKALKPSYPSRLPARLAGAVQGLVGLMADKLKDSRKADAQWGKRALALFSLAGDKETSRWALQRSGLVDDKATLHLIEEARRSFYRPLDQIISHASDVWAEGLYAESVYFTPVTSTPVLNRIGDLALTPVAGSLILFILLTAIYFVVGKFAAGFVVDFLVKDFFGDMLGPHLNHVVAMIPFPFLRDLLVGEYGLYAMALIPAFGLVLPVIVVFFFTFGFIEDSGYFSRLSILLNRLFRKIGLNGKAVLPMVLGFSCVTMATISTRVLDSKRERFIAIFLLSLGVPCSAKLSLILVIMAQVSFAAFLVVFGVVFALTMASGFILNKLMPVKNSHFIMEIPPIRIPSLGNVIKQTFYRSQMFLREALPLFILSALGLFFMEKIGALTLVEDFAAPVVKGFMALPPQFAESLIMGFIRGEAGIAVLKKMVDTGVMDHLQLVVAMIVTILFIPCVTNFLLIIKEQGTKKALAIIVSVTACAILTGGIMNYFLRWNHFTF